MSWPAFDLDQVKVVHGGAVLMLNTSLAVSLWPDWAFDNRNRITNGRIIVVCVTLAPTYGNNRIVVIITLIYVIAFVGVIDFSMPIIVVVLRLSDMIFL